MLMAFRHLFRRKPKYTTTMPTEPDRPLDGCFDCNICLDFAHDPVVTLCGHLYCWPCIYRWFHIQSTSLTADEYPRCPVCKAEISQTTVVPLYGRGQTQGDTDHEVKVPCGGCFIPPRPPACRTRAMLDAAPQPGNQHPYRNLYQGQRHHSHSYGNQGDMVPPSSLFNQGSDPVTNVFQPVVDMVGEMLYARMFGPSQNLYAYPNSYYLVGNSSQRLRRQEMQAEKSLYRVLLFLICGFCLCLLLF